MPGYDKRSWESAQDFPGKGARKLERRKSNRSAGKQPESSFTSHDPDHDQVGDLCQENVLGEKSYRVKIDIYRTVQARARGW